MIEIIKYIFNLNDKPLMLVPRLLDKDQKNAQNINARYLLPELSNHFNVVALYIKEFDKRKFKNLNLLRISPIRIYPYFIFIFSIMPCDIFFYSGSQWFDYFALLIRKKLRIPGIVVTTFEGISYIDPKVKKNIEFVVGHSIYTMSLEATKYKIKILKLSDHIISISPFLQFLAKNQFNKSISYINIGYDKKIFYNDRTIKKKQKITIVAVGSLYDLKRPGFFLKIAKEVPEADFIWFGNDRGELKKLQDQIINFKLKNISFRPEITQEKLAINFNQSHLFLMTSLSEGAPKVVLEAMACGLPTVLFGFYKPPFSFDNKNSFLVWNDFEFIERVKFLVKNPNKLDEMSKNCFQISKTYEWSKVAKLWSTQLEKYCDRNNLD